MAYELKDLIPVEDEEGAHAFLLAQAAVEKFPVRSWQPTGAAYRLLKIFGRCYANALSLVEALAKGGHLGLSKGPWLSLLSRDFFQNPRYEATFAEGRVTLSVAQGAGPYTIQPNQLWLEGNGGRRFNSTNATSVVLAAGPSSALVTFRAEHPGSAYNEPDGTVFRMVTPLPGVSAAAGAAWLTTQGADEEDDDALTERDETRWATIGLEKTWQAYVNLARSTPGVATRPTKVYVNDQNPRGPGSVDVWLAGPSGPLPATDVGLIRTYLTERKSPGTNLWVENASPIAVVVGGTVWYRATYTQALADAQSNVARVIRDTPIGGVIRWSEIHEAIMTADGVFDLVGLTLNGGTGNVALAPHQVGTLGAPTWSPNPQP